MFAHYTELIWANYILVTLPTLTAMETPWTDGPKMRWDKNWNTQMQSSHWYSICSGLWLYLASSPLSALCLSDVLSRLVPWVWCVQCSYDPLLSLSHPYSSCTCCASNAKWAEIKKIQIKSPNEWPHAYCWSAMFWMCLRTVFWINDTDFLISCHLLFSTKCTLILTVSRWSSFVKNRKDKCITTSSCVLWTNLSILCIVKSVNQC